MFCLFIEGKENSNESHFFNTLIKKIGLSELHNNTISLGGFTGIPTQKNQFLINRDSDIKNIVVLDADSPENGGGLIQRKAQIERMLISIDTECSIFLMPNNNIDGDFETLLEYCIPEKHQTLYNCFESYNTCVLNLPNTGIPYRLPNRKAKLYAYLTSFSWSRTEFEAIKKNNWKFENPELWNLETPKLDSLKQFFQENAI
jgi:hypothetical protein